MQYAIVIERANGNYSAYVPDLPGCIAVGDTLDEVKQEIESAIALYLEVLREDGSALPQPISQVAYVNVAA